MGFRFWKRVRIAPGLTLNLSKGGVSLSAGPRGAKLTAGKRGLRATGGLPGTGLFYTKQLGKGGGRGGDARADAQRGRETKAALQTQLSLSPLRRLVTSTEECAFVDGCRHLVEGRDSAALEQLRSVGTIMDGAFLVGLLELKKRRFAEAESWLNKALSGSRELGRFFTKYKMQPRLLMPITGEIAAEIGPDRRGVLLALVECCQYMGRGTDALAYLKQLRQLVPNDPLVTLSAAELLMEMYPNDARAYRQVEKLLAGVENNSEVHGAMLLYRARALRGLGLNEAARTILSQTLRKTSGRPEELLWALRYERALTYLALGQEKRARADFERIYAVAPTYEDVVQRLGMM